MSSIQADLSFLSENDALELQNEGAALGRLVEVATLALQQAIDLVDNSLTSDEQLTTRSSYIPGSTIGKHLRHARDHFTLLLDAVTSPAPHVLNYDKRLRNTAMESNRAAAREAFVETIARLQKVVPSVPIAEPITLHAITPFPQVLQTTFARELWFAELHAIHHWSMVRVIAGEMGIELEASFGFAPSTLVHMESKAPLGKPKM